MTMTISRELRLSGLWEQQGHQSSCEQQGRHQQDGDGAVGVHQLSEHDVAHDGCHSAHSGEEAQR